MLTPQQAAQFPDAADTIERMEAQAPIQGPSPEWKLSILVPEGWSDSSWHNDMKPSIQHDTKDLQIFVDEPDGWWMAIEGFHGAKRFWMTNSLQADLGEFETLEQALAAASEIQ